MGYFVAEPKETRVPRFRSRGAARNAESEQAPRLFGAISATPRETPFFKLRGARSLRSAEVSRVKLGPFRDGPFAAIHDMTLSESSGSFRLGALRDQEELWLCIKVDDQRRGVHFCVSAVLALSLVSPPMENIITHNNAPLLLVPLMYRDVLKERPSSFVYEAVLKRIEEHRPAIDAFVTEIRPFFCHEKFQSIPLNPTEPGEPFIDNPWFIRGDAQATYGTVAAKRPKRIIEIGSGNSTMFIRRAIRDFSLPTHLTSIDPAPRAEIDRLCDTVIRQSVLEVDLAVFRQLEPGDILFHDGSHLTFNGTDTVRLFLEILPVVPPGVFIHIHDICLPYEYYDSFSGRGYSEQYMLATLLLFSAQFEILLPVWYLTKQKAFEGGGSFWMRKRPTA